MSRANNTKKFLVFVLLLSFSAKTLCSNDKSNNSFLGSIGQSLTTALTRAFLNVKSWIIKKLLTSRLSERVAQIREKAKIREKDRIEKENRIIEKYLTVEPYNEKKFFFIDKILDPKRYTDIPSLHKLIMKYFKAKRIFIEFKNMENDVEKKIQQKITKKIKERIKAVKKIANDKNLSTKIRIKSTGEYERLEQKYFPSPITKCPLKTNIEVLKRFFVFIKETGRINVGLFSSLNCKSCSSEISYKTPGFLGLGDIRTKQNYSPSEHLFDRLSVPFYLKYGKTPKTRGEKIIAFKQTMELITNKNVTFHEIYDDDILKDIEQRKNEIFPPPLQSKNKYFYDTIIKTVW